MASATTRKPARRDGSGLTYLLAAAMLALALAFPIALMVFNPTLMFERGWEQFAGTGIYLFAVLTLARELARLRTDERAFARASTWLGQPDLIDEDDHRLLPRRIRQLAGAGTEGSRPSMEQLVELNREASGLDQEQAAGRFVLTRYILYLLPVIGFIGTVEGISKALMNISKVLPLVKDLDAFLNNLTGVTSALQIAFDSTLLALFLSAALMLVQTLVTRRAEELLARVDRWVVEHVLPRFARPDAAFDGLSRVEGALEALGVRLGEGLGPHVARFADAVDRLPASVQAIERGASAIGRVAVELAGWEEIHESLRRGLAALGRIEAVLAAPDEPSEQLDQIRRAVERSTAATEALGHQWAAAYEKSSRATQEQLARTLHNLKDALDLLNVSMEQGNALYRNIVKKLLPSYPVVMAAGADDQAA